MEGLARPTEELEHVDECVEEAIFLFMDAFVDCRNSTPEEVSQKRYDLYDNILAVVLRAREVPLLATDPGNQLPTSRRPSE